MSTAPPIETRVDFLEVLACPDCGASLETGAPAGFACSACAWSAPLVGGDTPSFVERICAGPRLRRDGPEQLLEDESREGPCPPRAESRRPAWKRALERTVLRWRRPLIRWIEREDPTYWREALAPLRADEMCSVIRLFERHLDGPRPWLLELGVGFQDHTELYDSISHAAICSDIYRDATAARIYTPRPNCLYGVIDVERLPFRPASFDLAFTSHVVEHFPDRLRDLRALRRILKPGALACHVVPMAGVFAAGQVLSTLLNVATLTPRIGRGVHGEFGSVLEEIRGTTRREWRRAFRESGFEVIDEASGTLGLRPLRPWMTGWIARNLGLHGSRVFLTRASVGDAPS